MQKTMNMTTETEHFTIEKSWRSMYVSNIDLGVTLREIIEECDKLFCESTIDTYYITIDGIQESIIVNKHVAGKLPNLKKFRKVIK